MRVRGGRKLGQQRWRQVRRGSGGSEGSQHVTYLNESRSELRASAIGSEDSRHDGPNPRPAIIWGPQAQRTNDKTSFHKKTALRFCFRRAARIKWMKRRVSRGSSRRARPASALRGGEGWGHGACARGCARTSPAAPVARRSAWSTRSGAFPVSSASPPRERRATRSEMARGRAREG